MTDCDNLRLVDVNFTIYICNLGVSIVCICNNVRKTKR